MGRSIETDKPSICIVSHNAYGVLADIDNKHVGGVEVQTTLLAKWLQYSYILIAISCELMAIWDS